MNKNPMPWLLTLAGSLLVWGGIKGQNPIQVLKNVLQKKPLPAPAYATPNSGDPNFIPTPGSTAANPLGGAVSGSNASGPGHIVGSIGAPLNPGGSDPAVPPG